MDRGELGTFLFTGERFDRDHAALGRPDGVRLSRRAPPTSRTWASNVDIGLCTSSAKATSPPSSRCCRVRPARSTRPSVNATRTRSRDAGDAQRLRPPHRPSLGSFNWEAGLGAVHLDVLPAGFIMAALDPGVLRDVPIAARHADPRTPTIYDHRRENVGRHAACVVVAFVAGG
jgi:hypothetical protein